MHNSSIKIIRKFVIILDVFILLLVVLTYNLYKWVRAEAKREYFYQMQNIIDIDVKFKSPFVKVEKPIRTVLSPVKEIKQVENRPEYKDPLDLSYQDKETIIKEYASYPKLVRNFWAMESSKGKNTDRTAHHIECRKKGQTNEFGFAALDDVCFDSFEESVIAVDSWIAKELETKSVNELFCYYRYGKATNSCDYAMYIKLL